MKNTHKNSVALPKEYFATTVFDDYSDPHMALIREAFQNHVDSFLRVKRLNETIDLLLGDGKLITQDNGCGMESDTIENVLLQLLGTDKGEGATGGKGRAKELIYFSSPEWSIRTGNLLVQGEHIDYTISEVNEFIEGTRNEIVLNPRLDPSKLFESFKTFIDKCSFSPTVSWNGEQYRGMGNLEDLTVIRKSKNNMDEGAKQDMLEKYGLVPFDYTMYQMPSRGTEVFIRSNGIFMYSEPFRTDKGIIFEIDPGISKYVLTGNRDGMKSFYKDTYSMAITLSAIDDDKTGRVLFNKKNEEETKQALTVNYRAFAPVFGGTINYTFNAANIYFDKQMEGKDIRIDFETPIIDPKNNNNKYSSFFGSNAQLSDDEQRIEFDDITFLEAENFCDAFELSNVVLKAKMSDFQHKGLNRNDEGIIQIGGATHTGNISIYDYSIPD